MMHDDKKNQPASAESVERRLSANENGVSGCLTKTQRLESRFSGLARIRQAAERDKRTRFNNLLSHMTPALLAAGFQSLRRSAARGVDGLSCDAYEEDLTARLQDLCDRVHAGQYRPLPARRVWIPKTDGQQRPLGIPALEDKIVQQALVWIMQSIYETDFVGFSYGFRPDRSCHNALDAVYMAITTQKVSWVLDADIKGFFDAVDHDHLKNFLTHRISDPRMHALLHRFLKAGVIEDGLWTQGVEGTPQGAGISPLLANIYLHYTLDLWVKWWRKRYPRGLVSIVRYADDFVVGFQYRSDAVHFQNALTKRLHTFSLELHPEKTRLIEFGRFAEQNRTQRGEGKPDRFDFLGFTHYCGTRRSDGGFQIQRRTIKKRFRAKVHEIRKKLIENRHWPISEQGAWLRRVTAGYLNYFSIPGNAIACSRFHKEVCKSWYRALRRRSQTAWKTAGWKRISPLTQEWIARVYVRHPYPNERLCV